MEVLQLEMFECAEGRRSRAILKEGRLWDHHPERADLVHQGKGRILLKFLE